MGGEHLDWLPVGWKVCLKVRSNGRKDKYYVNPSNGLRFNSKPDVLRYLKCSGKDRKFKELSKIEIKTTVAEKLPPGWIKEIRTKKKGSKTRSDPYYIDPVSGRYFRSMQEVFRYLESKGPGKAKAKLNDKGHSSVELGDHSQSSFAEVKGQTLIYKRADKNLTGSESVKSGLKLASGIKAAALKSVNMPEDGDLEQREEDDCLAIELSDKLQLANRPKQHADRTREIKKLAYNKVDKSADKDQRLKPGSKVAVLKKVDMPEENVMEQRERGNESVAGDLPNKLPDVNGKELHKGGRRQSMRLADGKLKDNAIKDQSLQSGSGSAVEKNINMPEMNGLEQIVEENNSTGEAQQQQNLAPGKKRKNLGRKWPSDLPRRTSKRLARVEVDPSMEVKPSHKAGEEDNSTKSIGKTGPSDELKIDSTVISVSFSDSNEHPSKCRRENPTNNKQKKPSTPVNLSSLEEQKDAKEAEKHEKQPDSSLKDLLMDPCIEFAIKTLTGAIPIEDLNKVGESPVSSLASPNRTSASSSTLPPGDIWADPCFEFAVKMLTSEMPVEDGSQLQISFQQPLSSPGTSGCNSLGFRLDNIYPSNYSHSQFDDIKKPCTGQQGVRDHGSSQNFVGTSFSPDH